MGIRNPAVVAKDGQRSPRTAERFDEVSAQSLMVSPSRRGSDFEREQSLLPNGCDLASIMKQPHSEGRLTRPEHRTELLGPAGGTDQMITERMTATLDVDAVSPGSSHGQTVQIGSDNFDASANSDGLAADIRPGHEPPSCRATDRRRTDQRGAG